MTWSLQVTTVSFDVFTGRKPPNQNFRYFLVSCEDESLKIGPKLKADTFATSLVLSYFLFILRVFMDSIFVQSLTNVRIANEVLIVFELFMET